MAAVHCFKRSKCCGLKCNNDVTQPNRKSIDVDAAYAWLIALAAFFAHLLIYGVVYCCGVFYEIFREIFGGSSSMISLTAILSTAFTYGFSKYKCRPITFFLVMAVTWFQSFAILWPVLFFKNWFWWILSVLTCLAPVTGQLFISLQENPVCMQLFVLVHVYSDIEETSIFSVFKYWNPLIDISSVVDH